MPRSAQTFTPELMASGRYRYEETDEFVHLIAADFGVSRSYFDRLVTKWGWRERNTRPARGLPAADQLLIRAAGAEAKRHAEIQHSPDVPAAGADAASQDLPQIVERLAAAVENELRVVEVMRRALGASPLSAGDAERTARTLATLTETLAKVQRLRGPAIARDESVDDVVLPADVEEFRAALVRRIETFMRNWRCAG